MILMEIPLILMRNADPENFDADPYDFDADPYDSDADPDPAPVKI